MTAIPPEIMPVDWRPRCSKCSRFVCKDDIGTSYTPWGKDLEFDGYTDFVRCARCGVQEVSWLPTRWVPLSDVEEP